MKRINKDNYYIEIAKTVSMRSTCERAKMGSIIVDPNKDDAPLGFGYNGSLSGHMHCDSKESCLFEGHCIRTTHSEINAICRAMIKCNSLKGMVMYSTNSPCYACCKTITAFGIMTVYYETKYEDKTAEAYANLVGLKLVNVK